MKVLFKEFITVWTTGLVSWLSRKFDSISIDLTPVEEKLDGISEQLDELDVHDENAERVAQFFGLPEALPEYTYATDQEVIDIVDEVYHGYFPTIGQTSEQATEQTTEQNNNI